MKTTVGYLVALGLLFSSASAALADVTGRSNVENGVNVGIARQTSSTGAWPDGNLHTYCRGTGAFNPANDVWAAAVNSMNAAAAASQLNTNLFSACTGSSGSADVTVRAVDLDGSRGQAACVAFTVIAGVKRCDRFDVRIDRPQIVADQAFFGTGTVADNIRKTTCHELGHSMGLSHYSAGNAPEGQRSCMISGHVATNQFRLLSAHHIDHVNEMF